LVAGLDPRDAVALTRVCTLQLAVENLAHDAAHLDQVRRERFADGVGGFESSTTNSAKPPELDIRLVLTAHPTDIARRSVLTKHPSITEALYGLGDPRLRNAGRQLLVQDILEALAAWYRTNEVRAMRPRVADEVRRLLYFFESSLVDAAVDLAGEYE